MTNSCNWGIRSLQSYSEMDGKQNVVFCIFWDRQLVDENGNEVVLSGAQEIALNLDGAFIPYENLTEEQVISWLETALSVEVIEQMDAKLNTMLQHKVNPPVIIKPLPWG